MSGVLFADATSVAVTYLRDALVARGVNAPVRSRVPNPRPTPFVLVRRVGGTRRDLVTDNAILSFECWGASEEAAHDLAQVCRALLFALRGTVQGGVTVYDVNESGGLANLPDPLSDQPRYVFTHQIALRGTAL